MDKYLGHFNSISISDFSYFWGNSKNENQILPNKSNQVWEGVTAGENFVGGGAGWSSSNYTYWDLMNSFFGHETPKH